MNEMDIDKIPGMPKRLLEECQRNIDNTVMVIGQLESLKNSPEGQMYEYFEEIKY